LILGIAATHSSIFAARAARLCGPIGAGGEIVLVMESKVG
jgi:hypothetical protein